jgi:hypothetical protein
MIILISMKIDSIFLKFLLWGNSNAEDPRILLSQVAVASACKQVASIKVKCRIQFWKFERTSGVRTFLHDTKRSPICFLYLATKGWEIFLTLLYILDYAEIVSRFPKQKFIWFHVLNENILKLYRLWHNRANRFSRLCGKKRKKI